MLSSCRSSVDGSSPNLYVREGWEVSGYWTLGLDVQGNIKQKSASSDPKH